MIYDIDWRVIIAGVFDWHILHICGFKMFNIQLIALVEVCVFSVFKDIKECKTF